MMPAASINEFRAAIRSFLLDHGFESEPELSLLRGGANNRVFLVQAGNQRAVLKQYFHNPNDPRDRFQAERVFYDFISENRIEGAPSPLGWENELRVGLFSFINGRKLTSDEVNQSAIRAAGEFVVSLNQHRQSETARQVLPASEACFSIAQHLDCIQRRVARLDAMRPVEEVDHQAQKFAEHRLKPAWESIRKKIELQAGAEGQSLNTELSPESRCLSPSDFGFHNALMEHSGLRFFDFEYAGWDDPAKLICDFFCQPELPASRDYWSGFGATISKTFPADSQVEARAGLLYPAYQLKWCCIILNDFLGIEASRREFALAGIDKLERKKNQLNKARELVAKIG